MSTRFLLSYVSGTVASLGGFNMSATSGTLSESDATIQNSGGELTHTTPRSLTFGNITWTAPSTVGTYTSVIRACGQPVNNNGTNVGDGPHRCDTLSVIVNTNPNAINDSTSVNEDTINNCISVLTLGTNDTSGTSGNEADDSITLFSLGTPNQGGNVAIGGGSCTSSQVRYSPAPNFQGVETFTYTIRDSLFATDTATVTVTVNNINDPPTISGVDGTLAYTENQAAQIVDSTITLSDIDSSNLNRAEVNISTNCNLSEDRLEVSSATCSANSLTCTQTDNCTLTITGTRPLSSYDTVLQAITYRNISDAPNTSVRTVQFRIRDDSNSYSGYDSKSITVSAVNDAPLITSFSPPTTGTEDTLYSYQVQVTDPDDSNNGIDLNFSLTNAPSGMSISSTGLISWTPTEGQTSSGTVTVTVQDGGENGAGPDNSNFSITVTSVNDAPQIINFSPPTTGTEGVQYSYQVQVSDPDDNNNGIDLSFSLSNAPAGMAISSTGSITWTPGNGVTSSGTVTITVQDGGENGAAPDSRNFSITVDAINDPPQIINFNPPATATEDITYSYQVQVSDPDDPNNGTDLSFSLSNAPTGMTISSTGLISWAPTEGQINSGTVTVTVRDGGENGAGPDSQNFSISVTAINDAPQIINFNPPTTGTEDIQYSYQVQVSDPDDSNNGTDLSFSLSNAPAGMVISSTGLINWTPTNGVISSGTVTVIVQDGGENGAGPGSRNFSVTITAVNDPPQIINFSPPTTGTEDTAYVYQVQVNDPDDANNGSDLSFSLSNAPTGMIISSTGLISWTPTEGQTNSGTVAITVQDGGENGASPASANFSVSVSSVNDAPAIASTAPTSATQTLEYQYQLVINDPDDANNGTDLIFGLSNAPASMLVSTTGLIRWTPDINTTSSGAVTVTVSDGGEDGALPANETFTITVNISDPDNDNVPAHLDNCPNDSNTDQADSDADGAGDVCDLDDDNNDILDGTLSFAVDQSGKPGTFIFQDQGVVTITAAFNETYSGVNFSYDWSNSNVALLNAITINGNQISLDPSHPIISAGFYTLDLIITETNARSHFTLTIEISPTQSDFDCNGDQIPDTFNTDCDGDTIDNITEGFADANNNGIPDFLDAADIQNHELANQVHLPNATRILSTANGLQIRLGPTARRAGRFSPMITEKDIQNFGSNNGGVTRNFEDSMQNIGGIYDFEISGLVAGGVTQIVIPLQSAIRANAEYRKYTESTGWHSFTVNAANLVHSAKSLMGICPAPGSSVYSIGLTPFHDCIQLTLEDGGPNDADGESNGVIRDPGGVAIDANAAEPTPAQNATTASLGGGSAMHPLELTLLLLTWICILRQRRKHLSIR